MSMLPRWVGRPSHSFLFVALLASLIIRAEVRGEFTTSDWPFVPLNRPRLPKVKHFDWGKNPIDAFVLARLEQAGLRPNPSADRLTLLRRVTFDLTGLAPTAAERDAFLADRSPSAYEKVVDRLLASPRFGERWAQHWLDVVRYAESEGFKLDRLRPDAYRYRDYVIRAFNDDLPYDRFVRQQLAGDELEPDNPDALIATGFLRLYPEESNGADYRMIRQDVLDDVTDVFGVTFLGLTLGCARCHDHKFDPITQKDYYRLEAFFAPLLQRDDRTIATAEERARYAARKAIWDEKTSDLRTERDAMLAPVSKQVFEDAIVVFDPDTQTALRTEPARRTALQQQLAVMASRQIVRRQARGRGRLTTEQKARYDEIAKKLGDFDSLKPEPLPTAMAVSDAGPEAPETYRLAGGNFLRPRERMTPGFPKFLDAEAPTIKPPPGRTDCTGRRSALARWLCRPDHPLTARVIVNRLWQHHFGQGIVATPNDFGSMGGNPTHRELLDYLAAELVRGGWHLKPLHRLIVTSAAYRQASLPELNPDAAAAHRADPENKLLWHTRIKRREAESIRDVALQIGGQLDLRMYGTSARPELPPAVFESRYAWYADERVQDRNRRSIYVVSRRNLMLPLFAAFDMPDRINSCPARAVTTTAPQALAMLNGSFMLSQARHLAGSLLVHHTDERGLARAAYLAVDGREPDGDELSAAADFLTRDARLIEREGRPAPGTLPEPMPSGTRPGLAAAVVDLCHALMNSAEFLYVE
jgi:hypothetical protein